MLVMTRTEGESIVAIGNEKYLGIQIIEIRGHKVRLGLRAPKDMIDEISRSEALVSILKQKFEEQGLEPKVVTQKVNETLAEALSKEELYKLTQYWER